MSVVRQGDEALTAVEPGASKSPSRRVRSLPIALIFVLACLPVAARAEWPGVTIQSENDAYPSWGDDDYTNGLRVSLELERKLLWSPFSSDLPDCRDAAGTGRPCRRTSVWIGQNFYTPRDIGVPDVQEDERPYSAWLYVGAAARLAAPNRLRSVEVHVGMTGRSALGEEVQTWWHGLSFIDAPEPRGWRHQVKPVPGLVGVIGVWDDKLAFERETRGRAPFVYLEAMPYYRLTGGNVQTNAAAGLTVRFGYNLRRRWAEKIAPTVRVASLRPIPLPRGRDWELGVFGSVEGRAVAWNALLQHDTYTPRELVPIRRGVTDLESGLYLGYKRVSAGFRWVWRSPEIVMGRWSRYAGIFLTIDSAR